MSTDTVSPPYAGPTFHEFDPVPGPQPIPCPFPPNAEDPLCHGRETVGRLDELRREYIETGEVGFRAVFTAYDDVILSLASVRDITPEMAPLFRAAEKLIAARNTGHAEAKTVDKDGQSLQVVIMPGAFWRAAGDLAESLKAQPPAERQLPTLESVAELQRQGVSERQIMKTLNLTEAQFHKERATPGSVIGKEGWVHPILAQERDNTNDTIAAWPNPAVLAIEAHRIQSAYAERKRAVRPDPMKVYPSPGPDNAAAQLSGKTAKEQRREAAKESWVRSHGHEPKT